MIGVPARGPDRAERRAAPDVGRWSSIDHENGNAVTGSASCSAQPGAYCRHCDCGRSGPARIDRVRSRQRVRDQP